jgi:hypothetical protein
LVGHRRDAAQVVLLKVAQLCGALGWVRTARI